MDANYSDLKLMCEFVTIKLTIFSILSTSQDSRQRSDWFTTFQWEATPCSGCMILSGVHQLLCSVPTGRCKSRLFYTVFFAALGGNTKQNKGGWVTMGNSRGTRRKSEGHNTAEVEMFYIPVCWIGFPAPPVGSVIDYEVNAWCLPSRDKVNTYWLFPDWNRARIVFTSLL